MSSKKKKSSSTPSKSSSKPVPSSVKPSKPKVIPGLEKLLSCGRCKCLYDMAEKKPKLLVCHHCYCMVCIETFIKTKENKTAKCPACSKITSIGRSGVAGLPDNEYLVPHLIDSPTTSEGKKVGQKEKKSPIDYSYDYGYYDEACGGDVSPPCTVARIFCQTCNNTATPQCVSLHDICNYEFGINALHKKLQDCVQLTGESLMDEVQSLEKKIARLNRIQHAWLVLGNSLDQTTLSQTVSLSAAKALLDQLPDKSLGSPAASHGDPSILVKAVLETESIVSNSAARLKQCKALAETWNILSHCNVTVQTPATEDAPGENFYFTLQLNERTNEEVLCLMYAMGKIIESKHNRAPDGKGRSQQRVVEAGPSGLRSGVNYSRACTSGAGTSGSSEWIQMKKGKGHDASSSRQNYGSTIAKRGSQGPSQPMSTGCQFCFFDLTRYIKGEVINIGRVIVEINYRAAPKMSKNFLELCSGKHGFGYSNTFLWRIPAADHVDGGEIPEGNNVSVFNRKPFYGDASSLQDDVGMLRMRGLGTETDGQPIVGNSFMVWVRSRIFKSYARTLVFGKVREGLDVLLLLPETRNKVVKITECGLLDSYK